MFPVLKGKGCKNATFGVVIIIFFTAKQDIIGGLAEYALISLVQKKKNMPPLFWYSTFPRCFFNYFFFFILARKYRIGF